MKKTNCELRATEKKLESRCWGRTGETEIGNQNREERRRQKRQTTEKERTEKAQAVECFWVPSPKADPLQLSHAFLGALYFTRLSTPLPNIQMCLQWLTCSGRLRLSLLTIIFSFLLLVPLPLADAWERKAQQAPIAKAFENIQASPAAHPYSKYHSNRKGGWSPGPRKRSRASQTKSKP